MLQEKDQEHRIQGIHVEVLNTQFLSRFKEASDDGERYPTINSVLLVLQAESANLNMQINKQKAAVKTNAFHISFVIIA